VDTVRTLPSIIATMQPLASIAWAFCGLQFATVGALWGTAAPGLGLVAVHAGLEHRLGLLVERPCGRICGWNNSSSELFTLYQSLAQAFL
jgi:hypothetical protein